MQIKEGSAEEDNILQDIHIQKPNPAILFVIYSKYFQLIIKNMLTLMMIYAKFSSSFHLLVAWQFLDEKQCYHFLLFLYVYSSLAIHVKSPAIFSNCAKITNFVPLLICSPLFCSLSVKVTHFHGKHHPNLVHGSWLLKY